MKIVPYLSFAGNCEEALNYYKELLKGEIAYISRYGDGPKELSSDSSIKDKILHAKMIYNGEEMMYFADDMTEGELKPGNVSLNFDIEDEAELNRIYDYLSKDAKEIDCTLQETFWKAKFASLIDKYGIHWSMNYDMSQE